MYDKNETIIEEPTGKIRNIFTEEEIDHLKCLAEDFGEETVWTNDEQWGSGSEKYMTVCGANFTEFHVPVADADENVVHKLFKEFVEENDGRVVETYLVESYKYKETDWDWDWQSGSHHDDRFYRSWENAQLDYAQRLSEVHHLEDNDDFERSEK